MNKTVKAILYILNGIMLILAFRWYFKEKQDEPLIVIIGQVAALFTLLVEGKLTKVRATDITRSEVGIRASQGSDVGAKRIEDSELDIDA